MKAARRRLEKLNEQLESGSLTPEEWADKFDAELLDGHAEALRLGRMRGGDLAPDEEKLLLDARGIKDGESTYLQNFLNAIKSGDDPRYFDLETGLIKPGSMHWRTGLYVGKMRGTANQGFTAASFDEDADTEFDWELGAEHHCEDCPRIAAMSPYNQSTMYTDPGAGDTECLGNCDCRWVRRDGVKGFPRLHLEDDGVAEMETAEAA